MPGEQLNITVNAETDETIVVSTLSEGHTVLVDRSIQDYSYATAEVSYGSELLWTRQIDICQKEYVDCNRTSERDEF